MAKNGKRMSRWTMAVIESFDGKEFTVAEICSHWKEISPPKYAPPHRNVVSILKRLIASGKVERVGTKKAGRWEVEVFREVKLDE